MDYIGYGSKYMRDIKMVVLHCSDSDDSLDYGFKEINQWHKERGFVSPSGINCGYHYIIRRNGSIELGRPEEEIGAHVKGYNSKSLGICWIGRKQMSDKQLDTALKLIKSLIVTHKVDIDKVFGHYELDSGKTCPNLDMNRFRAELLFVKQEDT